MTPDEPPTTSEQVVLAVPTRRDGEITCKLLQTAGVSCTVTHGIDETVASIRGGIGALILTDIVLARPDFASLLRAIEEQPDWSDLPVLALCREGFQSPGTMKILARLRNLTVLDRPASTRVMVSAVQAALRGRLWQYRIRDQIADLVRAEATLRQADLRKDEFLATLAHELRNPLAPIKTGLQLLRRGEVDAQAFGKLRDMMDRQLSHLVRLIDELLDVSRISTGKIVLKREPVDLAEVIRVAVETSEPAVASAGHELVLDLPEPAPIVRGDATRLAQSVSNLLNNAAKYTPHGGRIEVSLATEGPVAVVAVKDNGIGIPDHSLDSVFDMFTQVHHGTERAQGGLGIGLSLVKNLVSLHGGQVSAASEGADQGSVFTIRLPRVAATAEAERVPRPAPPAVAGAPADALRVMVVDDNRDAAQSFAMLLTAMGHEARVEYGGAAGLAQARAFDPHLIFCDVGMPVMDGLAFATEVRRDPTLAAVTLVALTGWGAAQDRRRSLAAGFDFHLTKPAGAESIEGIVAQMKASARGRDTVGADVQAV